MSKLTKSTARRLRASPLPVMTMLATGVLALGGCATSSETHSAKPAVETASVSHHEGSSLQFLADQMAKQGKYDAAIPLYRRAHALHPRAAGPLFGLGKSLAAVGANSEAAEALIAAHDRDSDNPEITVQLANIYLATSRPELALPLYEEALAKEPNNAAALNGKALALDVTGDHQTAQTTYEAGLAADPDNLKLESNLGLSLALNGKTAESIQMLEDVATDSRAGPSERQNLALAYAFAGRDDDAMKVASIDVDPTTAHENLAYFSDLKSMSPDERTSALLVGVRQPKQNTDHPANFGYGADEEQAKATIKRVVGSPSAAIVPLEQPAVATVTEPQKEEPPVQKAAAQITAPITEVPPPLGNEGYAVQIAAYRKAEQLVTGWNILHQRYIDLIGTLSPRRSEVDFGPREKEPRGFFYRLNAGPLTTFDEARQICTEIQARGGPCWVRSPEPAEGHLPGAVPASPPRTAAADAPKPAASGQAKLDVEAVVKDQAAQKQQSATVWQQIGSSEENSGTDANSDTNNDNTTTAQANAAPQDITPGDSNAGASANTDAQRITAGQEESQSNGDEFSADPPGDADSPPE